MQKLTQKSNKEIISEHKSLSIQVSLDGFSFCIKDIPVNEILVLSEYAFSEKLLSPNLLADKINYAFENDKDLQIDFDKIIAVHENRLVTQVPNTFFDETQLKAYLQYNIKTLASDFFAYDNIATIQAKNVYVPYVNINNFLFQNFGEFEFKHHSTILIEQLSKLYKDEEQVMFVNVTYTTIDIIIFNKSKFTLFNSFSYRCKEDFIYYILLCAEQLEMNVHQFQLYFLGNITSEYETYKMTYEYVKNVHFIEPDFEFLEKSEYFFAHSHYTLLS